MGPACNPAIAADLARKDARLSHRGCAVECSAYIAALAALIPVKEKRIDAVEEALNYIDKTSDAYKAVEVGKKISVKLATKS